MIKGEACTGKSKSKPVDLHRLIDRVKVLRPTRHKLGHFRDVLSGSVLKKLNEAQQKQATQE